MLPIKARRNLHKILETQNDWVSRLVTFLNSEEAYALLGDHITSWMQGGCWTLAEALRRILGQGATLYAVASSRSPVEHVVVKYRDSYLDAEGSFSAAQLLARMEKEERIPHPILVTFTRQLQTIASREIPCPLGTVESLVVLLRSRLGNNLP